MAETPNAQMLELLVWIASGSRTYAEAMAAWTSNCPREPVWDDAVTDGLIEIAHREVTLTERGRALILHARG